MKWEKINQDWYFKNGTYMLLQALGSGDFGTRVELPHDYMISSEVREDAPAGSAMGYFTAGAATYTKFLEVPKAWRGQKVLLYFDGAMMNAKVSVDGDLVAEHHYGYTPFVADLTDHVVYGGINRICVVVNPSMQPNSRWYTGAGLFRSVYLAHGSRLYVKEDGIFSRTVRLEGIGEETAETAVLLHEVTVRNDTDRTKSVRVQVTVTDGKEAVCTRSGFGSVHAGAELAIRVPMTLPHAKLWDAAHPALYRVKAEIFTKDEAGEEALQDAAETGFGVRTVSADSTAGLLVNGKSIKLKGGCNHHDNGLLGAVSLYDAEVRKLELMKKAGYNAVRLSHNPPSRQMLEAADTVGMYVLDEAFDAWGFSKQPGDYSQFFASDWKRDMKAFITRDRNHPSILLWSTGNEVEERGGLGDGYQNAEELAAYVRTLDDTRLVTCAVCSLWSGTRDRDSKKNLLKLAQSAASGAQNFDAGKEDTSWEDLTENYMNCLDVVGYNYMDSHYAYDHERYPERVILGTESYPKEMDRTWQMVEEMPWVIGDFTWTSFDYLGEAGIGKSMFLDADDPRLKMGAMLLASQTSGYPWRLANDADFSLTGEELPQGVYREILWGSERTGLFTQNPANHGKEEIVSGWGWNEMSGSWNYAGFEGQPVKVYVYTRAEEAELFLNGKSLGRKPAGREHRFTAVFEVPYEKGVLRAVSVQGGKEISAAQLETTGAPSKLVLLPERTELSADGESLAYVRVLVADEAGRRVPDAAVAVTARLQDAVMMEEEECNPFFADAPELWQMAQRMGAKPQKKTAVRAVLAGFGSDNPVTKENYTTGSARTYQGSAMAIVRSGHERGTVRLVVSAEGMAEAELCLDIR